MKKLIVIMLSAMLFVPAQASAKSIHCPSVVTQDIKTKRNAIRSCDTFYITRNGQIKKIPKRIRNRYVWN